MKKTPSLPAKGPILLGSLGLAALGQYFLAQRDLPWTLWPGLALYGMALFLFLRRARTQKEGDPSLPLSRRGEAVLLSLILAVALFFRLFQLDRFPAGVFTDEASMAWGALRILREGWRPFSEVTQLSVWNQSIYYLLALWFNFFPASQISLWYFSVLLAMAALPLLYWAFRQWTGPSTALAALFFVAVMRWHVTYSRDAHPAIEILIYMAATLAFWFYALRTGKTWAFLAAGFFCGAGLYSYQAYKPFPLVMALYAFYEWKRPGAPRRSLAKPFLLFFATVLAVSLPVWWLMVQNRSLGGRESELFAFPGVLKEGILWGPLRQAVETALAFNRQGDGWYVHNLPYHRLLDDGTGMLFLLGLGWSLFHWRERRHFYAVTGLLVMALPAFLSVNPAHASRLFGTIPFVAVLAAEAFTLIAGAFLPSSSPRPWAARAGLALFLGFCALQNFWVYFGEQAKNDECWRANGTAEASWIADSISRLGGGFSYLICPRFYDHLTLHFLAYDRQKDIFPLKVPTGLDLGVYDRRKGVCLVLNEGQQGVLRLFQSLYPGGTVETFRDLDGNPIAYLYLLSAAQAAQGPGPRALPRDYGLEGTFRVSPDSPWSATETDPILNFTFHNDFPFTSFPPLWASWAGQLDVPFTGTYDFLILCSDHGSMELDGRPVIPPDRTGSGGLLLRKGLHPLRAEFQKTEGKDAAFTLLWKKPGDLKYEVIPVTAFRRNVKRP